MHLRPRSSPWGFSSGGETSDETRTDLVELAAAAVVIAAASTATRHIGLLS